MPSARAAPAKIFGALDADGSGLDRGLPAAPACGLVPTPADRATLSGDSTCTHGWRDLAWTTTTSGTMVRDPNRNFPLAQLARTLQDQSARAVDIVAGSGAIHSVGGRLVIEGVAPQLRSDGVTMTDGTYTINDIANTGIAAKLGIPGAYLRKLGDEFPELYDMNVNGWLNRTDRRFMIRALRTDPPPTLTASLTAPSGHSCPTATAKSTTSTS